MFEILFILIFFHKLMIKGAIGIIFYNYIYMSTNMTDGNRIKTALEDVK